MNNSPCRSGLCVALPLLLRLINHQQNLKLLRRRDLGLFHQPCWGGCLLHYVCDGAEEPGPSWLGRLRLPLRCRWCGWRCWRSGRRLGRGGGSRWRRLRWVRPLKVCHVAIGEVGDESAVRETPAQIIHGWRRVNKLWEVECTLWSTPSSEAGDGLSANS